MYSTCTFCNHSLGANRVVEHFPVGRRLAFDEAQGRLWVICRSCSGWNLSPLEERWEAIEELERLYRETRLRVSTDNIGLARARDGTDLVRVGKPQRPELAAWRYGDQFAHRRRKHLITAGVVATGAVAAFAGIAAAGFGITSLIVASRGIDRVVKHGFQDSTVARVKDDRGVLVNVLRRDLSKSTISADREGQLVVSINMPDRNFRLRGEEARRGAAQLFRAVNRRGGDKKDIEFAVGRLARAGSAEQFLRDSARRGRKMSEVADEEGWSLFGKNGDDQFESGLLRIPPTQSLAIEMALHEDQERRVLEGELVELENSWREAEEIGSIADSLLLPAGVQRALDRLRG